MNALEKLLDDYNFIPTVFTDTLSNIEQLNAFMNKLKELVESTAYVVPKCPKCGSDDVAMEFANWGTENEVWLAFCSCQIHSAKGNTPAEAAAAFGRKD